MRTRLSAILGTAAAIVALAALAFGLNLLFRPGGPPVPSAPSGPHPASADEALWVHVDAAWDKDLAHQTTAILQRQSWWDGEIILFTCEDNLPDSAGDGRQQVLSWVLVEPAPLEPGWTVVASGNRDVIHWPAEQAMPTPADVGVYSFFLSQRQDNLGRAMSVIYGLWADHLDVPDTVQLTLDGQEFDAPLENESFLYVTEGHIAGQRPQIRWTCDSPGGAPCGISLRTDEPLPEPEPLTFGGEIRSDELTLDSLTGKRIPFTIGQRDSTDPLAPGQLYLPSNVYFDLRWRVVAPPSADWNVFVHLLNAADELVLQSDVAVDWPAQPCPDDEYDPKECIITTGHEWQFPADFPAGLYTITVGLYDPRTGVRAPVTSPPGATSPVALGQVQVMSSEPSAENTQVALGIFSGRPNPSWTLTPAQDAELRQRLDALTLTDQPFPYAEMKLGYYGFALLLPASEGMPSRTVSVFKGIVQVETTGGQVTQLADDDRVLERWLLITATGYVEPDVIEAVRQELEPTPTPTPTPLVHAIQPAVSTTAPTLRETPLALPSGLSVEEYALEEVPQAEPLTFAPVEGSAREILSRHQDERRRYFPDRSFPDDGHFALAVSLGNERLVATEIFTDTGNTQKGTVELSRDGETIYTIQVGDPSPITTLRGLWVYDNHWVLEVAIVTQERNSQNEVSLDASGQIIQDGESLNERYGYQEAFGFQMMRGKPFCFSKKDGQIGISYDNQAVPLGYSQVPHYWCCSAAELNPLSAENMVAFFAQRAGTWYYVEVGVFE